MPRFFATCARGLEQILAKELVALSAVNVKTGRGGVNFEGGEEILYRASLHLRTAVRVLQPVIEADVYDSDGLYEFCRSIDWSKHMTADHTLAVDSNVKDSNITHSQYAARRVKDAICDQFRDRVGIRPSVDTEQPMIGLNLHLHRNHAVLSLDASWDSLHKRGYRPILTRAPINESLAAGLLLSAGYDGTQPLVDLMCGSGTFLIEGAWIATKRPPGLTRKWFGFMGWPGFNRPLWNAIREEARVAMLSAPPCPIRGSDLRADAVEFANTNSRTAGVRHMIHLEQTDLHYARPGDMAKGIVIVNPPYGERLGEEQELVPLYRDLGHSFREHWFGWKLCVFTLNDTLAKAIDLRVLRQTPFYNGSLPCKLWVMEAQA
ncbi:THUMP domain-containing protein [soil metagenome]